jgi:hypothetical protein
MRASILALFVTALSAWGGDICKYHEDFRFLLAHSETLAEMQKKVATFSSLLDNEVEIFAAENINSSCDLLYTSTYMLLQQHAALVDVYVQTSTFEDSYILPSIEMLLRNCAKVRAKCKKYLNVVRNPELFQQILNLDEIAKDIQTRLGKYAPKPKPAAPPAQPPQKGKTSQG